MKTALIKIIFILVLGFLLFVVLRWDKVNQSTSQFFYDNSDIGTVIDDTVDVPQTVIVEHYYNSGTHELRGNLTLPNTCYGLESGVVVAESLPEQVTLNLVIIPPSDEQICAQVLEVKNFSVNFTASPNPIISAQVNGREVTLVTEDKSGSLGPIDLAR